jgi:hypothetical protein
MTQCELCREDGGAVLWRDGFCRVVLASERALAEALGRLLGG